MRDFWRDRLRRNVGGILVVGIVALHAGCGPAAVPKAAVSGTVTLDGKPMEEGEVSFVTPGLPPELVSVRNGTFQGKVGVGSRRIEIRAYRLGKPYFMGPTKFEPSPENYLPARFNSESNLVADVTAAGPNEYHWEVQSH